ncbi:hypothetical protein ACFCX0_29025 [Streptomyces sp. NPDC056352]|uniref:hypothetical protein n=1 Tax=Streptomyces sp. NPDC056352 TaxID=3345791 RepID=UPI0035DA0543
MTTSNIINSIVIGVLSRLELDRAAVNVGLTLPHRILLQRSPHSASTDYGAEPFV